MIGKHVAHYRIEAKLGEGGMGEVYRARDTKLNRDVALKILPQVFALDSERMARFEREAQVLASLNHTNIAQIYGLEEMVSGRETRDSRRSKTKALVLELVPGQTLQEKIAQGPIPVDEALKIALQICEGLEAAHEKGIIHRDLKPANIKITPEEQVKILDFGLAKALEGETPVSDLSHSPTITHAATQAGMIMGTAAYMSPEQARGKPVDKRTDIWAFGCVLYEMLAAKRAFDGENITDLIAAIVKEDPDWNLLPIERSGRALRLLRRCLKKDPRFRLHDIADVRIELTDAEEEPEISPDQIENGVRGRGLKILLPVIMLLIGTAVGIGAWSLFGPTEKTPEPRQVQHLNLKLPEDSPLVFPRVGLSVIGQKALALSPDGATLVYVSERPDGTTHLIKRPMGLPTGEPIQGTDDAFFPFFSPNGEWVGFFSGTYLKKVRLDGGIPIPLCEASVPYGATWTELDEIVFSENEGSTLSYVDASGGVVNRIPLSGEVYPSGLPGGEEVLISGRDSISIISLRTGTRTKLALEGVNVGIGTVRYLPSGHLLYTMPGRLMVAPFDLKSRELTGAPFPIIADLRTEATLYAQGQFAISDNGILAYVPGESLLLVRFVWVDEFGNEEELALPPGYYQSFSLSKDGNHLAFSRLDSEIDIWIYDFKTDPFQLTNQGNQNIIPIWTTDGNTVFFSSNRDGQFNVFTKSASEGTPAEQVTAESEAPLIADSVSPDGRIVALGNWGIGDIQLLKVGEGTVEDFISTEYVDWGAIISPDGRYLVYTISGESAQPEVYVTPFPSREWRKRISSEGGWHAQWSPKQDAIFYRYGDKFFIVQVETEPEFRVLDRRVFVQGPYVTVPAPSSIGVHQDGKRLLLLKGSDVQKADHFNVITNWFEELKRLVPTE